VEGFEFLSTVFGVFKESYVAHQYGETLLDDVASIVGESAGDLHVDSAGLLAGGAEAWVSISTKSLLSTPQGVEYYPHILAATSLNGTLATSWRAVNQMVVCDNTRDMAMGERNGSSFKVKHTRYSVAKLESARQALGLIVATSDDFEAEVKRLCEQEVTDAQWSAFVQAYAPLADDAGKRATTMAEATRERLSELWNADPRVSVWKGTAFGALQAANTFEVWDRQVRGATVNADRQVREAITGKLSEREDANAALLSKVLLTV
jgi:phage/plasmid-like protein (TIGR03299 family)